MRSVDELKNEEIRLLSLILEDILFKHDEEEILKHSEIIQEEIINNYDLDVFEDDIKDILTKDKNRMIEYLLSINLEVMLKVDKMDKKESNILDKIENNYVLTDFLDSANIFYFKKENRKLIIYANDSICAKDRIELSNYLIVDGSLDACLFKEILDVSFDKVDDFYCFKIITSHQEYVSIKTKKLKCITERFNALDYFNSLDPFRYLSFVADEILISGSLNDDEIKIIDVLEMLASLTSKKIDHREILLNVFEMFEVDYLEPMLDMPEVLLIELSKRGYKNIYDYFLKMIYNSQIQYPSRNVLSESKKKIIDQYLKDKGYSGSYPDYIKEEKVDKFRLIASYQLHYLMFHTGMTYFVSFRNITRFDDLYYLMNVGGAKNNVCDCYDQLMFNNQGDSYVIKASFIENDNLENNIKTMVDYAELKNMSSYDKRTIKGVSRNSLKAVFGKVFSFAGLFFSLFMLVVTFIIELSLLFESKELFISFISKTPWFLLFLGYWLLFGLILGIIYVIGYYKNIRRLDV